MGLLQVDGYHCRGLNLAVVLHHLVQDVFRESKNLQPCQKIKLCKNFPNLIFQMSFNKLIVLNSFASPTNVAQKLIMSLVNY